MKALYPNKILLFILLTTVLLYNCASQKKYTVTETRRLQTVQALPVEGKRDSLERLKPALTLGKQHVQAKATPAAPPNDGNIIINRINKDAAAKKYRQNQYRAPEGDEHNHSAGSSPNENATWNWLGRFFLFIYVSITFILSLSLGLSGLLTGIFSLFPILIAAFILFRGGRSLRAEYNNDVKNKVSAENRDINLQIAVRLLLKAFAYLFCVFILFSIPLIYTEASISDLFWFLYGTNGFFILLLLVLAIVLGIIYIYRREKHESHEKQIETKQGDQKPNTQKDTPYVHEKTPWFKMAYITMIIVGLIFLFSEAQPILYLPLFPILFMLSLRKDGRYTLFTRILLALAAIGMFIAHITVTSGLLFPIVLLIVSLLLIAISFKFRKKDDSPTNVASISHAMKNIGIMIPVCIIAEFIFSISFIETDLIDAIIINMGYSVIIFLVAFIILAVSYILKKYS